MAVFALGASNVVGFTDLFVAARAGDGDGVGRAVVVWCAGRFLVGVRAVAALGAFTVRRGAGLRGRADHGVAVIAGDGDGMVAVVFARVGGFRVGVLAFPRLLRGAALGHPSEDGIVGAGLEGGAEGGEDVGAVARPAS